MNINARKLHTLQNIVYGFSSTSRKWEFTNGTFTLLQGDVQGKEMADKIAAQVRGSLKRTKNTGMDQLGRVNINKTVYANE